MHELASVVEENGYIFLPQLFVEWSTHALALRLGLPAPGMRDYQVETLRARATTDALPNTYGGNYGLGSFPLHSDLAHWACPPRYILLRAKVGGNVQTPVWRSSEIVSKVGLLQSQRTLMTPRRPIAGKRSLLRLLEHYELGPIRWDPLFLVPADQRYAEAFYQAKRIVANADTEKITLANEGDSLIIDNWRMLHGRSAVNHGDEARLIDRVYMGSLV